MSDLQELCLVVATLLLNCVALFFNIKAAITWRDTERIYQEILDGDS